MPRPAPAELTKLLARLGLAGERELQSVERRSVVWRAICRSSSRCGSMPYARRDG